MAVANGGADDGFAGGVGGTCFDTVCTSVDTYEWIVSTQHKAFGADLRRGDHFAKDVVPHGAAGKLRQVVGTGVVASRIQTTRVDEVSVLQTKVIGRSGIHPRDELVPRLSGADRELLGR